jgi:4-oxalocrotonate tautomerase
MPHIALQISGHPDTELTRRAVAAVGELTQRVLRKEAGVIATTVTYIPREQWFIAANRCRSMPRAATRSSSTSA